MKTPSSFRISLRNKIRACPSIHFEKHLSSINSCMRIRGEAESKWSLLVDKKKKEKCIPIPNLPAPPRLRGFCAYLTCFLFLDSDFREPNLILASFFFTVTQMFSIPYRELISFICIVVLHVSIYRKGFTLRTKATSWKAREHLQDYYLLLVLQYPLEAPTQDWHPIGLGPVHTHSERLPCLQRSYSLNRQDKGWGRGKRGLGLE